MKQRSRLSAWLSMALVVPLLTGCDHTVTSPRDLQAPAAPRGVYSVTGDGEVFINWLHNTESDVAGYRVYEGPCASGSSCPYTLVASTTDNAFVVDGLANGVTRFFAVTAFDYAGNESPLSFEDVFDTPRPEGFSLPLANVDMDPDFSGYDFSAYQIVPFDDQDADIFFGASGGTYWMYAAFTDTDIQGSGYTDDLDDVDYAPVNGWAPSGTVELIVGHAYVVWTHDDHYAKFRVRSVNGTRVLIDWAYQVDPGNRELRARRAFEEGVARTPRDHGWARS